MENDTKLAIMAGLLIALIALGVFWALTTPAVATADNQPPKPDAPKKPPKPIANATVQTGTETPQPSTQVAGNIPTTAGANASTGFSILLGRPTNASVALNIIANSDSQAVLEYGVTPSFGKNATVKAEKNEPVGISLANLSPDTQYYYRMSFVNGTAASQTHSFHTQRQVGSEFTFVVEADPHLDEQSSPEVFNATLDNILSDKPDFMIDLGDTFMSDKLPVKTYETIKSRHVLLRNYFDITGADVPLFLVLGNHEGESGWERNGQNSIAVWATNLRKLYYPNPSPDGFYTGSTTQEDYVGLRDSYYAFEWGDALIVAIDPYWYTSSKPNTDSWGWTLGKSQYDWLAKTLNESTAKYKFVFAHQLVGGDGQGRGGTEQAAYYEWGGNNLDGSYGFDSKRPGWGKPIHQLLVENKVDVFFHGHDHFYDRQEKDGVVYQLVPQPSHPGDKINTAESYGYLGGEIIGGSGYMRVQVSQANATVSYVRANGTVASSYSIS